MENAFVLRRVQMVDRDPANHADPPVQNDLNDLNGQNDPAAPEDPGDQTDTAGLKKPMAGKRAAVREKNRGFYQTLSIFSCARYVKQSLSIASR